MLDEHTRNDVLAALHGEAFAYARYTLFAAAAREGGDERLASLFDGLAAVELHEHFAELADLSALVGSDEDNLAAALLDENDEVERSYPAFAEAAHARGAEAIATRFEEMAEDEREHERALEDALERIAAPA